MSFSTKHLISLFLIINLYYYFNFTHATTFSIQNNCPYTIWTAAIPGPVGGKQLNQGQTWTLNVDDGGALSIWARTKCTFNGDRRGKCGSGDCEGQLECKTYGTPPFTLAELSLNQPNNIDFFDMSLANGFNVPMELSPISMSNNGSGCTSTRVSCVNDVNGPCPTELRDPGGCNNPCSVFQNDQFCCTSGNCGPTVYSRFFKNACPNAYYYPNDDVNTTFSCPSGTNYKVLCCP